MKEKHRKKFISIFGFALGLLITFWVGYPLFEAHRQATEREEAQEEERLKNIETRLDELEQQCPTQIP